MSRVLVVMTSFNAAEYLPKAISSVVAQTFKDWQLVICDDGSTDPSVGEILSAIDLYGIEDRRVVVRYLNPTEADRRASVRYASNINEVVRLGVPDKSAEYLTFLCSDDLYYPTRLQRMVDKLDEDHDVVYGTQRLLGNRPPFWPDGFRYADRVLEDAYHVVDLNSVMLKRVAFESVGGFPTDPSLWRDADAHFWRRLTSRGFRFVPVDDPIEPTDAKNYRDDSVDMKVRRGETPW